MDPGTVEPSETHAPPAGRNETDLERADRNLVELLQEVRVVQTGVQVMFAFLLSAVFQQRFHILSGFQRAVYFGTLLMAGAAVMLLTAPSSHHRILFRRGDKPHLVEMANRLTMIGLAAMALAMIGVLTLVSDMMFPVVVTIVVTSGAVIGCGTLWYALPLARRRRIEREPELCSGATATAARKARPPAAA